MWPRDQEHKVSKAKGAQNATYMPETTADTNFLSSLLSARQKQQRDSFHFTLQRFIYQKRKNYSTLLSISQATNQLQLLHTRNHPLSLGHYTPNLRNNNLYPVNAILHRPLPNRLPKRLRLLILPAQLRQTQSRTRLSQSAKRLGITISRIDTRLDIRPTLWRILHLWRDFREVCWREVRSVVSKAKGVVASVK